MVDWHDPVVVARCARMSVFIQDLSGGWYMWEFCVSLGFDWDHLTGKHSFRWPQIAYFGSRYLLGLAGLLAFRTSLVFGPIDCKAWYHTTYALAHTCVALGSLLLFLRVIAVSGRNKIVIGILGLCYQAQIGALINAVIRIDAVYMPELMMCGVRNSIASRLNFFVSFGFDTLCLLTMFLYLFGARGAGLWGLLLAQGATYFMVVIAAYAVPAALLILNLNDFMNEMLKVPSVVVLVVCTTRMYRSLVDFYDRPNTEVTDIWTNATTTVRRDARSQSGILVVRTQEVNDDAAGHGGLAGSSIELSRKRRLELDEPV